MGQAEKLLASKFIIPGNRAEQILTDIANWGSVTTIILQIGSVFEFKGPFPKGTSGFGYYNLAGPIPGFHGHLKLDEIDHIAFQEKPHRGRESYALVFNTNEAESILKIFLGRDEAGELITSQKSRYNDLKKTSIEVKNEK